MDQKDRSFFVNYFKDNLSIKQVDEQIQLKAETEKKAKGWMYLGIQVELAFAVSFALCYQQKNHHKNMLQDLKKQRDKVDMQLVQLIAQRLDLSHQIVKEKQNSGQELHLRTDEIESLDKAKIVGDNLGLNDSFLADLFAVIFTEERRK